MRRKYVRYAAPFESRVESRERWRKVYMKFRVTKGLLLCTGSAVLMAAIALWGWWERQPMWWYPVTVTVCTWLFLAGGMVLLEIRAWRSYVSTAMYMEAIEDGLCKDRQFTSEGRDRWYRDHGSPWRLQPVPESMRVHQGPEEWPML